MVPIQFYQPNKVNITIQFPTTWDELTMKDIEFLADAIWDETILPQHILIRLFEFRVKKKVDLKKVEVEQLVIDGLPLVNFITNSIELTKYPLADKSYKNNFLSITIGTCEKAEPEYFLFNKTKEEKHLFLFAKALINKKLTLTECRMLWLWYTGCRNQLPKRFKHLYSGKSQEEATGMELTTLIHLGAGERNGTRDKIRNYLLNEFLYDMDLEAKRNNELKNQIKDA